MDDNNADQPAARPPPDERDGRGGCCIYLLVMLCISGIAIYFVMAPSPATNQLRSDRLNATYLDDLLLHCTSLKCEGSRRDTIPTLGPFVTDIQVVKNDAAAQEDVFTNFINRREDIQKDLATANNFLLTNVSCALAEYHHMERQRDRNDGEPNNMSPYGGNPAIETLLCAVDKATRYMDAILRKIDVPATYNPIIKHCNNLKVHIEEDIRLQDSRLDEDIFPWKFVTARQLIVANPRSWSYIMIDIRKKYLKPIEQKNETLAAALRLGKWLSQDQCVMAEKRDLVLEINGECKKIEAQLWSRRDSSIGYRCG